MNFLSRFLAKLARDRAEDLRWRAFMVRVFARGDRRSPTPSEVRARLLDLRARNLDEIAEWLGGR